MKQSRIAGILLCATVIFLTSCAGGDSDKKAASDTTAPAAADTTTKAAPAKVNTIITTPQNMMVVEHKVANFTKWKASYDQGDSMRLASGVHSYVIGRGFKDSNMVLVAVKVDDLAKAKAFAKGPDLKKAMQKSGVVGMPSVQLNTMTFQDTATLDPGVLRSRTNFTVKDWATWQKSFEEGAQERMDNGIAVRAYGHSADDDKKVVLVTAVLDTAKAFAYYKSDALKKRRAAGGAMGEPVRFLYHVVARY